MQSSLLICLSLFFFTNLLLESVEGKTKVETKHREHHAHDHGQAKLEMAWTGNKVAIIFESDTKSIYGFEHEAQTQSEKSKVEKALKDFRDNPQELFKIEGAGKCTFVVKKVEIESDGEAHSDQKENHLAEPKTNAKQKANSANHGHSAEHRSLHADYDVDCENAVLTAKLILGLGRSYPGIKKINTQILSDFGAIKKSLASTASQALSEKP